MHRGRFLKDLLKGENFKSFDSHNNWNFKKSDPSYPSPSNPSTPIEISANAPLAKMLLKMLFPRHNTFRPPRFCLPPPRNNSLLNYWIGNTMNEIEERNCIISWKWYKMKSSKRTHNQVSVFGPKSKEKLK